MFKENNCETGGFSFFSPYYLDKDLAYDTFNSEYIAEELNITVHREGKEINFMISDIVVSEGGTMAELNIVKDNITYLSKIHGGDLTIDSIVTALSSDGEQSLVQAYVCPPCLLAAVVIVADFR